MFNIFKKKDEPKAQMKPRRLDKKIIIHTQIVGSIFRHRSEFNPGLSIGIESFYRLEETKRCIESLLDAYSPCPFEIIILDNNSDEETKKGMFDLWHKHDNITIIFSPHNLGVGRGRNLIAEYSEGEYILLVDNDALFSKNFISALYYEMINDDSLGVVFAKILEKGKIITIGRKIKDGNGDDCRKIDFSHDRMPVSHSAGYIPNSDIDLCPGGGTLYRASLLKSIKFDPRFYHHEDWDFTMTIKGMGYKIKYCPLAVMFHYPTISGGSPYTKIRRNNDNILDSDEELRKKWNIARV